MSEELSVSQIVAAIAGYNEYMRNNQFDNYYQNLVNPKEYKKHVDFINSTAYDKLLLGGNRVGKSHTGGWLVAMHAMGEYPDDYQGARYRGDIEIWVAGESHATTRDIIQKALLGDYNRMGGGMIRKSRIIETKVKHGLTNAVSVARIKRKDGSICIIDFKSYEQGRGSFQGTRKHLIWLDEEAPDEVIEESRMRLMSTDHQPKGTLVLTYTPFLGMTKTIQGFMEDDVDKSRKNYWCIGWDDVPHLKEEEKIDMMKDILPQFYDCRTKGIPNVGSGTVYPINPDAYLIEPFEIPKTWHKCYGMDVGNRTAVCWLAVDPNGTWYLYDEYFKEGEYNLAVHADAINSRGKMLKGAIDTISQVKRDDGRKLFDIYEGYGLKLYNANKMVESGIQGVWQLFTRGKLKIFNTCNRVKKELQLYCRDEQGKIVKEYDDALDALRYAINTDGILGLDEEQKLNLDAFKQKGFR